MSQENVEIVRAGFEAWNAGDVDTIRDGLDPGVVLRPPEGWPEPGPYVGPEAVMRQWAQVRETWDGDALELVSDFVAVGDRVAVRAVWHGAGRGPEAPVEMTYVITVRKGKLIAIEEFWDHSEALETLGLSEQTVPHDNATTLRQGLDAFFRRDKEAWLALCDPDYKTVPSEDWPEMEPIRGAEAAWDFYVESDEPWERTPFEFVDAVHVGEDRTVGEMRREMRGKASGAVVTYSYWVLATFRNGKVLRIEWFTDRAEALAAAGRSE
jgi:uncharacterized protein